MKPEEAVKILKSKMDGSVDTSYEWAETIRMAIEGLKKQIPIEPKLDKNGDSLCPKCGKFVNWLPFCWGCGQAISWSEDNDV